MVEKEDFQIINLPENVDPSSVLNLNVGVLGHVDSGKTSISKRLSTIASTACFDKNPQSKERGITLDLGFSAFYLKVPNYLKEKFKENQRLQQSEYFQITLVDCPGHASLIRTVVAGAAIIDVVLLVIDCIKGIQIQTTECLVLSEILTENMVVALNKIDQIINENDDIEIFKKTVDNKVSKLKTVFQKTKYADSVIICPISADPSK
jgi:selenocysteine-specific elongation factor